MAGASTTIHSLTAAAATIIFLMRIAMTARSSHVMVRIGHAQGLLPQIK